jgi:hypothetical protein
MKNIKNPITAMQYLTYIYWGSFFITVRFPLKIGLRFKLFLIWTLRGWFSFNCICIRNIKIFNSLKIIENAPIYFLKIKNEKIYWHPAAAAK